ncbi:MAG: ATP-binding protein [Chloroflexi bacterium]|nr:ATP-binding protein [Chloroflexota bacterium]
MGNEAAPGLPYEEKRFVDRQDEVELVLGKARAIQRGELLHQRTVAFYGPSGSGKSWLLGELNRRLHDKEFASFVVLLAALHPYTGEQPVLAVEKLLYWAAEQIGKTCGITPTGQHANASLSERSNWLCEDIKRAQRKVALLVDDVDEVSPDFLRELESYFLAPLVKLPGILVVLAGRTRDPRPGEGYTWKSPELKLYSVECDLGPFDEQYTKDQLARQRPEAVPIAAEIREAGGGYPLSNWVLGGQVAGQPPAWKDKAAALKDCADALLGNVEATLQPYFWALCVLRAFDEERMPPLLATYFGHAPTSWSYAECRRLREEMVRTRLARWMAERGGFAMDEAVRTALENALQENDREMWQRLHRAAYELYAQWVKDYPRAAARWQPEADYHAQCYA